MPDERHTHGQHRTGRPRPQREVRRRVARGQCLVGAGPASEERVVLVVAAAELLVDALVGEDAVVAHAAVLDVVVEAAGEKVAPGASVQRVRSVAADEAMARVQAPIWASEDLKTGLASFRKNGPGLAKFAGR